MARILKKTHKMTENRAVIFLKHLRLYYLSYCEGNCKKKTNGRERLLFWGFYIPYV